MTAFSLCVATYVYGPRCKINKLSSLCSHFHDQFSVCHHKTVWLAFVVCWFFGYVGSSFFFLFFFLVPLVGIFILISIECFNGTICTVDDKQIDEKTHTPNRETKGHAIAMQYTYTQNLIYLNDQTVRSSLRSVLLLLRFLSSFASTLCISTRKAVISKWITGWRILYQQPASIVFLSVFFWK